jgi:hypothetical protein
MRGTFSLQRGSERSEILWLSPEAAYFRPHVTFEEANQLLAFAAGGRSTKVSSNQMQGAPIAARAGSGLALIDPSSGAGDTVAVAFEIAGSPSEHFVWTVAPPGSGARVVPLTRGDESSLVVAWSASPDGPPRGFLIPLRPGDSPAEPTDLGLAALLGEHPRACAGAAAPGSVRLRVGLPRAARRPVLVDGDAPALLRADAALVVVPPQGAPCVSAWIAHGKDRGAIVPVAAPARAVSAAIAVPPKPAAQEPVLTLRGLRCEEAPGLAIPASFGWKGF